MLQNKMRNPLSTIYNQGKNDHQQLQILCHNGVRIFRDYHRLSSPVTQAIGSKK